MEKIFIRRTNDKNLIVKLDSRIFPNDIFYEHENNHYWTVKKESKVIGFCMATVWEVNKALFLSRAGIIPSERGKGLQRRMIRVRENFARKNKIKDIITYVSKDNIPSFVNLIKSGYFVYEPQYLYAGSDNFYLIKRINC